MNVRTYAHMYVCTFIRVPVCVCVCVCVVLNLHYTKMYFRQEKQS